MAITEIFRDDWKSALTDFSRDHEGWLARVQEFGPGTGSHEQAQGMPFIGLEVEGHAPHLSVSVILGTETDDHVTHTVTSPTQVWNKTGEDAMEDVLEIHSADGLTMILRLRRG